MSRQALTAERALAEAMALADTEGLSGLTMRKLASRLGVEAMSLYHHLPNKDALLDGMVDQDCTPVVLVRLRFPEKDRQLIGPMDLVGLQGDAVAPELEVQSPEHLAEVPSAAVDGLSSALEQAK